jgi:pseudouridine synthase
MPRLHKVLARAGLSSRRGAERMIEQGRVAVNGRTVERPGVLVDPRRDAIEVDGQRIRAEPAPAAYFLLHKPRGCLTTLADPRGRRTVAELIGHLRPPVRPVGRLDYNSEGLLLLTNDGDLARALMHPSSGIVRTYVDKVRGEPDARTLARLRAGVPLDGRPARPRSLRITRPGHNAWVEVAMLEGRKHVVRRLFAAVGHPVVKLKRTRYASLSLGSLPPGGVRALTRSEIARLRRAVERPAPRRRAAQSP